jgi:hypothetical protein
VFLLVAKQCLLGEKLTTDGSTRSSVQCRQPTWVPNNRVRMIQEAMSDLEDCARDLYQLTLLSDEIQVRDQIDRCIHEYLAKAKWHSSVGAEKADLATVFEAISSATHANELRVYVLHSLRPST